MRSEPRLNDIGARRDVWNWEEYARSEPRLNDIGARQSICTLSVSQCSEPS